MMEPLGTAVVGLGIGEQHAHMYARLAETRVRWLYDFFPDKARAVRERVGQGEIAERYEQVLGDPKTKLVSIATFDQFHHEQVVQAFAAGKHLLVEKPLCRTVEELADMKRAWMAAGRPHLRSNLVLRAAPVYIWLRQAIEDGILGEVYAFDGDYLYGRIHKITEGWRKDVPDYSVMAGGGIHLVDLMLGMCGERPSRATTVGANIATRGTAFRYADFMSTTFEFPSGIVGRVTANYGCVHRHHHIVRVFGTKATFIYDDQGPRLHETRDETVRARALDVATLPHHKGALIPDLVAAILEGADSTAAAQREFDLVCVGAAADRSLAEHQPLDIGYV